MKEAEVIIVGGGPAGSTCARELIARGRSCLVLDRQDFPRDKLCAGWITPWCARDLDLCGYPHGVTAFRRFVVSVRGRAFPLRTMQYAIRRREFDAWLLARSGAPFHRHQVRDITREAGGFVLDNAFRCRFLVGAGGTACPVYRRFFAQKRPRSASALISAIEEEFEYPWKDPDCRLFFGHDGLPGYSWYVPKAGGVVNVGIGGYFWSMKTRGRSLRRHWDLFAAEISALGLVRARDFASAGHSYYLRHGPALASDDGAYLIGDSASLATRDLGEGIGPAVKSAILAAEAVAGDKPLLLRGIPRHSLPRMILAGLGLYPRQGQPRGAGQVSAA